MLIYQRVYNVGKPIRNIPSRDCLYHPFFGHVGALPDLRQGTWTFGSHLLEELERRIHLPKKISLVNQPKTLPDVELTSIHRMKYLYTSIYLAIDLSVYLSMYLSIIYLSIYLSIYL